MRPGCYLQGRTGAADRFMLRLSWSSPLAPSIHHSFSSVPALEIPTLLESHGIKPIIHKANVGEDLQKHWFVPFSGEVADGQITAEALCSPEFAQVARRHGKHEARDH
ncbi:uncharacterized protein BP01DRAFT_121865 [Aspergillus saccharolyticus JOP 1030-1]|uniref:Uncharacterized protein n=1 Tax=Aspergillus saccharolyticus JOP 1030-1 TaxID=1450539 RepID=A0A318Z6M6_9EURO|nr:hypothetical protein BP01DRAFT_121865 [Aspergillus saccharolyticus JOP 1030-1]PYH42951.1 hypothetical protein BP01DRAFT_121865 [Aspergillus saccharolyticus JOP 1030-1]